VSVALNSAHAGQEPLMGWYEVHRCGVDDFLHQRAPARDGGSLSLPAEIAIASVRESEAELAPGSYASLHGLGTTG